MLLLVCLPMQQFLAVQVRIELADTQEALRLARVAIEERDFLVAAQQQCEATIAGARWLSAEGFIALLWDCTCDAEMWQGG